MIKCHQFAVLNTQKNRQNVKWCSKTGVGGDGKEAQGDEGGEITAWQVDKRDYYEYKTGKRKDKDTQEQVSEKKE